MITMPTILQNMAKAFLFFFFLKRLLNIMGRTNHTHKPTMIEITIFIFLFANKGAPKSRMPTGVRLATPSGVDPIPTRLHMGWLIHKSVTVHFVDFGLHFGVAVAKTLLAHCTVAIFSAYNFTCKTVSVAYGYSGLLRS